MTRIANVVIPSEKQVQIALRYIFGIGPKHSADILKAAKVEPTKRVKDLTEAEEKAIRDEVDANYTVEGDLQRVVANNIKRLKDIQSYRGSRHAKRLPARGQRTKTNARTLKGVKKTMGSGRRKLEKT